MKTKRGIREHIYHFIDNDEEQNIGSISFEYFITFLILVSILCIVLESLEYIRTTYKPYFDFFEQTTLIIFITEYVLRIFTADFKYKDAPSLLSASLRFMRSGSGIIDLLAISPLFFQIGQQWHLLSWANQDLRFVRILKITRLLRVMRLNHFTNSISVIVNVCYEKKNDLGITIFVTFILLFVSATVMWYIEGHVQPEQFPNILATLWWAVATLTTVGYGDVYPITAMGKFMAGTIALLGIGLVALPAGILSSAFIEKLEDGTIKEEETKGHQVVGDIAQAQFQRISSKKEEVVSAGNQPISTKCTEKFGSAYKFCPYCGKPLDEHD